MKVMDGHVHAGDGTPDAAKLLAAMGSAGVSGGIVISLPPASFGGTPRKQAERLDNLLAWTGSGGLLHPFYWIDPTERDASRQVDRAVERGVAGFKVICDHFSPGDRRAMRVFGRIAERRKPMLFHSGILWDGKPSAQYNRPGNFEALLDVEGLVFSLAHISWPWCDELVAVYGKFLNAMERRPGLATEMFVDTTPGTPPIYRRDALTRLFTAGYDVEDNVVFGTDCETGSYNAAWAREWLERDGAILDGLGITAAVRDKIRAANLDRFLRMGPRPRRKGPRPADT
jgi:predicted TIM-barrel fold metal-dependent hydrolase